MTRAEAARTAASGLMLLLIVASCGSDAAELHDAASGASPGNSQAGPFSSPTSANSVNMSARTVPPGVPGAVSPPIFELDFDGVVPASMPLIMSQHLASVQLAVRATRAALEGLPVALAFMAPMQPLSG